jgi:hypothetical protein
MRPARRVAEPLSLGNTMKRPRLQRDDALTDPRFWAMHYCMLIGTEEVDADDFIEPFFGVSTKEVNDYFLQEFDQRGPDEAWPYLEVPVRGGFTVQAEYAGTPSETRFYINHVDWPEPVALGYDSGHFALPAFRWCEVAAIGRACTGINAARALLLAFPAVGLRAEDEISSVQPMLVEAWRQLGVINRERLEEMTGQNMVHRTGEIRWWEDPQLGWINDGRYSFRNPKTLMCDFAKDRFNKVAAFFAGIASAR